VEFAYNRAVHSTTQLCPFEVVYGFKPITPLDMLPSQFKRESTWKRPSGQILCARYTRK
jgi:hypothetical protein